jgi:hypothetical protein
LLRDDTEAAVQSADSDWNILCLAGGIAALILLVYSLATLVQLALLGGEPATANEAFTLLHNNRILGLVRLDLPTALALPFYYILLLGLFGALKRTGAVFSMVSTALSFVGVTLIIAAPGALSMLALSDKYSAATTDLARSQLQAAGEAILAADMWHGTAAFVGGLLLQCGTLLVSVVMLRSNVFSKTTAIVGIVAHGLDLVHILLPGVGVALMAVAGPLYLIWFPMVGLRLLQLGRSGASSRLRGGTV